METRPLHLSCLQLCSRWRVAGGGGFRARTAAEYIAQEGVGLHRLGGSRGAQTRLTIAVASTEVSAVELRSEGSVLSRSPGFDGFCLLGALDGDPITYVRPVNARGEPVGRQSLLL